MNEDGVRVTRIDWLAAIPSLRLFEAIRMAISPCVCVPAFLLIYLAGTASEIPGEKSSALQIAMPVRNLLNTSDLRLPEPSDMINSSLTVIATRSAWQTAAGLVTLSWWMLMLGFCGVAAMRSAGCRFCTGTGTGLITSIRFSMNNWKAILISSLLSWILLGLLSAAFRILGWAGITIHTGFAVAAAILYLVGCMVLGVGWLLSLAAIAVDRCDGAEALSRGISYVLSRWLRVLAYTTVFCLIMVTFNLVMQWFAEQAHFLASSVYRNPDPLLRNEFAISVESMLDRFVQLLGLSIFLCEIAIAYVLLRNVEDGVSLREIDGGSVNRSSVGSN
jgi:hypothetical protein